MVWGSLYSWEWAIGDSIALGLGVFELVAINRRLKRTRAEDARREAETSSTTPHQPSPGKWGKT